MTPTPHTMPNTAVPPTSRLKDFFAVVGFLSILALLSYTAVKVSPYLIRTGTRAAVNVSTAIFFPTKIKPRITDTNLALYERATLSWTWSGGAIQPATTNPQSAAVYETFNSLASFVIGDEASLNNGKPELPEGSLSLSFPCIDGIYFMIRDSAGERPAFCNTVNTLVPTRAEISLYPLRSAELAARTTKTSPITDIIVDGTAPNTSSTLPLTLAYYKNGAKKPFAQGSVFITVAK